MTTGHSVLTIVLALSSLTLLAACNPDYSPDTYSSGAVQHAEKVDQGTVVGVRMVAISADPTIGTATGGAAGGIAGSQVGQGAVSALSAVGGTVAGGIVGNVVAHATDDTSGYEYIVRKSNGDLLSVTQKDAQPLAVGQHVLIIEGPQARVLADYTVQVADAPHAAEAPKPSAAKVEPPATATPTPTPLPQTVAKPEASSGSLPSSAPAIPVSSSAPPTASNSPASAQPAVEPPGTPAKADARQPSQAATAPAPQTVSPSGG